MGAIHAVLGLVLGILTFLYLGLLSTVMPGGSQYGVMMLGGGIIMIVFYPVTFFIIGFIGGAIMALLFNIVSPIVGGMKVEVE